MEENSQHFLDISDPDNSLRGQLLPQGTPAWIIPTQKIPTYSNPDLDDTTMSKYKFHQDNYG